MQYVNIAHRQTDEIKNETKREQNIESKLRRCTEEKLKASSTVKPIEFRRLLLLLNYTDKENYSKHLFRSKKKTPDTSVFIHSKHSILKKKT